MILQIIIMQIMIKFNLYKVNKQMNQPFQCSHLNNSELSLRSYFFMTATERLIYLIGGSLDMAISIFNLVVLLSVHPLRQPPSDILFILTVYTMIKTALIYTTVIYDDYFPPFTNPDNYQNFCITTGFIEIAGRSAKFVYTLILTFIYSHKVKNPLKAWTATTKEIHFVSIFIILLLSIIAYFSNSIGMTMYGYCGVAFSISSTYFLAATDLIYLLALIIASSYFLRNVRNISANNTVIKQFFTYYLCFLLIVCLNQTVMTVGQFLAASACANDNHRLFQSNKILVNISSCSLSIFVLAIILSNRQFRRVLSLRLVKGLYSRYKKWIEKKRDQPQQDQQIRPSFYEELLTTNRRTILLELTTLASLDQGYLSDLKDKSRACFLSSVLGCFSLQNYQIKKYIPSQDIFRTSVVDDDSNQLFSWNYFQKYTFTLTNSIVDHYTQIFTKKLPPVSIKFTSYSPNVLYSFAEMNRQSDIWKCLSPCSNEKEIAKDSGGGDGGNSGQFFFFNHNKTLILKTISSRERKVFIQRLEFFHKHFLSHPHSLIVKIYSVAGILNIESGDEVNFCLMGNILRGINRQYVIRSYDLKGSLHSREILKGKTIQEGERISKTLKDVDFERLQQKIWISGDDSRELLKEIQSDSKFMYSQGLIDYSLLVIKLDEEALREHPRQLKILKQIKYYRSLKEDGIVYVIGIIDYLQTWNLRKKGEKWYKSFFTQKNKISSQNPKFYSDRFIQFANKILTPI